MLNIKMFFASGFPYMNVPWNACGSLRYSSRNIMNPTWPKRIDSGHGWVTLQSAQKTCLFQGKIRQRFWSGTKAGENVPGEPAPRDAEPGDVEYAARRGWTIALQVRD